MLVFAQTIFPSPSLTFLPIKTVGWIRFTKLIFLYLFNKTCSKLSV